MLPELFSRSPNADVRNQPERERERFGPAFAIHEPVSIVSPVVFASPHSGRLYPESFTKICIADRMDLRRIEDAYVDRLLSDATRSGAPVICGLIGRAFIDLNRAETEMDRDMFADAPPAWRNKRSARVAAGLGCVPRVAHNGAPIYRDKLPVQEAEYRVEHVYRPYHQALDALLRRAEAMFGQSWLIDCHSMPAESATGGKTVDIVLGDRFGGACSPKLSAFMEQAFRSRGYSTARNAPYAGGYATMKHGRPGKNRHALQIEIRRGLYMDEHEVEPHDGLVRLRAHLAEIADGVSEFARGACGIDTRREKKKAAP